MCVYCKSCMGRVVTLEKIIDNVPCVKFAYANVININISGIICFVPRYLAVPLLP